MKAKWKTCFWIFLCVMVFSGGCAAKEKDQEKHVKSFGETLFSPISAQEYEDFQNGSWKQEGEIAPEWVRDRFQEHMTQEAYEKFLGNMMYTFPVMLYEKEEKLEEFQILRKEDYYEMKGKFQKPGEEGAERREISGRVQTDSKGLISYAALDEVWEKLME